MKCAQNGVGADFGNGHVYPGDRFECPQCGQSILATNGTPTRDDNYTVQEAYLDMRGKHDRGTKQQLGTDPRTATDTLSPDFSRV